MVALNEGGFLYFERRPPSKCRVERLRSGVVRHTERHESYTLVHVMKANPGSRASGNIPNTGPRRRSFARAAESARSAPSFAQRVRTAPTGREFYGPANPRANRDFDNWRGDGTDTEFDCNNPTQRRDR